MTSAPDLEPYLNIPKCDDEFFHEDCFVCAQCFQERVKKCSGSPGSQLKISRSGVNASVKS